MNRRFYVPKFTESDSIELEGPEAHHLISVLRAAVGTRILVFDGVGHEGDAVVEQIHRRKVRLRVESFAEVSREPATRLTIATALPKGGREKFLVEKCTELGVRELIALETDRSVVKPSESFAQKARRWVIEASKQCGRNELMRVTTATLRDVVRAEDLPAIKQIAVPHGETWQADPRQPAAIVLIGPEGGFSEDELATAQNRGWNPITLGARILRLETAAIAVAAGWLCR